MFVKNVQCTMLVKNVQCTMLVKSVNCTMFVKNAKKNVFYLVYLQEILYSDIYENINSSTLSQGSHFKPKQLGILNNKIVHLYNLKSTQENMSSTFNVSWLLCS